MSDTPLSFECVLPLEDNARLIMAWRNDPQTLRMSFNKEPKVWPAFFSEFLSDYYSLDTLPPLFIVEDGQRKGFLRFRPTEHPQYPSRRVCEISLNIAPPFRGQGIGTKALLQIKAWVLRQGYDDIYAEILRENTTSQRAFERAGFSLMTPNDQTVPVYRYLAPLTPETDKTPRVFVIAEAGSNWRVGSPQDDWEMAKTLIDVAAEAGADAVKFQTYRPETIYVKNAGSSGYLADAGIGDDMQTLFAHLAMPYEMIPKLSDYCKRQNIAFMSTSFSPADFAAVDPYVSIHKIASYEITHIRLIELAARSGKPLILSTGASQEEEIAWAVSTFRLNGGKHLTLLQCTAKYPAEPSTMNLRTIEWMRYRFNTPVGLSDHSRHPIYAPVAAVALGASVIEKHFTFDNNLPGPDHAFALNPHELKEMVKAVRAAEVMRGSGVKKVLEAEKELYYFAKRGVQATQDIAVGDIFKEGGNIEILRPGKRSLGVHPRFLNDIEGKPAKRAIASGSGIALGDW